MLIARDAGPGSKSPQSNALRERCFRTSPLWGDVLHTAKTGKRTEAVSSILAILEKALELELWVVV